MKLQWFRDITAQLDGETDIYFSDENNDCFMDLDTVHIQHDEDNSKAILIRLS